MESWYAVQTKPRQEDVADANLVRQGFHVYLPKVLVRRRKRDRWVKVVETLFPRYLFVQVNTDQVSLAPIRSTLGVVGLVRFGHILKPVPDSVIAFVRQSENPDTRQLHADDWPHQPGDEVEILQGPFAGLTGIFQAGSAQERALLLIELLGRSNTIDVPRDALAAVSQ